MLDRSFDVATITERDISSSVDKLIPFPHAGLSASLLSPSLFSPYLFPHVSRRYTDNRPLGCCLIDKLYQKTLCTATSTRFYPKKLRDVMDDARNDDNWESELSIIISSGCVAEVGLKTKSSGFKTIIMSRQSGGHTTSDPSKNNPWRTSFTFDEQVQWMNCYCQGASNARARHARLFYPEEKREDKKIRFPYPRSCCLFSKFEGQANKFCFTSNDGLIDLRKHEFHYADKIPSGIYETQKKRFTDHVMGVSYIENLKRDTVRNMWISWAFRPRSYRVPFGMRLELKLFKVNVEYLEPSYSEEDMAEAFDTLIVTGEGDLEGELIQKRFENATKQPGKRVVYAQCKDVENSGTTTGTSPPLSRIFKSGSRRYSPGTTTSSSSSICGIFHQTSKERGDPLDIGLFPGNTRKWELFFNENPNALSDDKLNFVPYSEEFSFKYSDWEEYDGQEMELKMGVTKEGSYNKEYFQYGRGGLLYCFSKNEREWTLKEFDDFLSTREVELQFAKRINVM
eukprot:GHVR01019575.1.p1 GENE.GHVR01019575.1~~GHVR01019575.1.p1  ORF type:complete len:575 (+),score=90.46 GHVR01019575.1:195-1727(+)